MTETTLRKSRDLNLTSGEFAIQTLDGNVLRGIYDSIPQAFWNDQDELLYKVHEEIIDKFNFSFTSNDIDGSVFNQLEIPELRTDDDLRRAEELELTII